MNINKLRGRLVEKSITIAVAADYMDISRSALYRKLHRPHLITVGDATKLKELLKLTNEEAVDIFLS